MKMCFIGFRGHHGYAVDGLKQLPELEVSAISAGCADDLAPLQEKLKGVGRTPPVSNDWRKMLDEVKPEMVCIDGPFDLHAEMCVEAIKRGIHVFCEKPIALSLDDLERVRKEYGRTKGIHLSSMVGLRYDPAFMSAWKQVKKGAVGKVKLITTQKSYGLGKRPDFFKVRSTYGGTIPWVGSHSIDWAYWFSGSKFKSVYARHDNSDNFGLGDMEMSALFMFEMQNGILASGNIDYLRPKAAKTHGDDRVRVAGTDGVIEVIDRKVTLIDKTGERQIEAVADRQIFVDFVRHIQGKSKSLVDAEQTFDLTEACLLARESADTGKIINF
ncbi:MAG TPA: gfo/Idh/MocA family oxidoreductase [Lentisphaeria bacterium]|nr:MAG: hypothetical protein A2X48_13440 [Lentisphaerae bacterium GWF2_49_21]HBC89660.1 gfo/Idh/MocA family oxidoreductase [Lentisphaeria bacterium]